MSSEVPLDLSNESKPIKLSKKKYASSLSTFNGTKSNVNDKNVQIKPPSKIKIKISDYEPQSKKQKISYISSNVNPLQRGKYGLRMMPQQVDYYQSILEERRIKLFKESQSVKQNDDITKHFDKKVKPLKIKQMIHKTKPIVTGSKYEFEIGDIVWATLPNYKTWFPALIISHMHCKQKPAKRAQTWVYWFGDHQVSEIPKSKVKPFIPNFTELSKGTSSLNSLRMKEALQVLASRAGITFPLDENVASSSSTSPENENALILWAKNGFKVDSSKVTEESTTKTEPNSSNPFSADPLNPIPSIVACYLPIDSYQDALKTDERLQQIVYYDVDKTENTEAKYEIPDYKLSQMERIKRGEVLISEVCIACCCDAESAVIGNKSADNSTLLQHPLFEGGLCRLCYDNIKVTMYAPGADNKNSFCAICGQLGKLAICENDTCHRVYCLVCIDLLVGNGVHLKVLETDKWECYLCKPSTEQTGHLKPRLNWRQNIKMMFDPIASLLKSIDVLDSNLNSKRKIRVLSLLDGISTAKIALEKIGLKIDSYFASESDSDAINISKKHNTDSITFIESLENISIDKIASINPIDFVIGASPCNESSFANSSRKGLLDSKGSAYFLLYFNHILHLLRLINKGHHVFFLFQNSYPLSNSQRDIISNLLMCKPVTLYANRNHYYWSNIPGIKRPLPQNIQEKFISLINTLISYTTRKRSLDKSQTSQLGPESVSKTIDPNELEKLFGLEENYTDANSLTNAKRQQILTNSWCIPILSHLLWSLNDFFI